MATRERQRVLQERRDATADGAQFIKSECTNVPLRIEDERYVTAAQLRLRLAANAFTTGLPPVYAYELQNANDDRSTHALYLSPTDAYTTCFLSLLDAGVIELVRRTFADEREAIMRGERLPIDARRHRMIERQQPDEPGVVYCFWNIVDRPDLKKIGRTRRRAENRGREWEHTLAEAEGQQIVILFSVPTKHNVFAERVVHAALLCEHQPKRVNEKTGRLLTEYFRVNNVMALKLFVMLCVGYVDSWVARTEHEFRTTSPLYEEWRRATRST